MCKQRDIEQAYSWQSYLASVSPVASVVPDRQFRSGYSNVDLGRSRQKVSGSDIKPDMVYLSRDNASAKIRLYIDDLAIAFGIWHAAINPA